MSKFIKYGLAVLSVFLVLISLLFSPYRMELDLDEPQINEDSVEFLRLLYGVVLLVAMLFFAKFRSIRSVAAVIILSAAVYSGVKLALSFFL